MAYSTRATKLQRAPTIMVFFRPIESEAKPVGTSNIDCDKKITEKIAIALAYDPVID
jgi:hypothetical protein